jgi:hypothetical protein
VEPFDTWADMSHLVHEESLPSKVGTIGYYCSVLRDAASPEEVERSDYPERRREEVRQNAVAFLETWIDSQYFRANVEPSDRYSLSLPGTLACRISPLDPAYENFAVAGDWTRCGFNEGCVEAAVMSGRLAAHALSASPPLEEIVGFDHP